MELSFDDFLDLPESHARLEYDGREVLLEGVPLRLLPQELRERALLGEEGVHADMAARPTDTHEELVERIQFGLMLWRQAGGVDCLIRASFDVLFPGNKVYQPDIAVWVPGFNGRVATPVNRAPTLCIEVLSKNRAVDRVKKRAAYLASGQTLYWIVDHANRCVDTCFPDVTYRVRDGEIRAPSHLPGFYIPVAELFEGL